EIVGRAAVAWNVDVSPRCKDSEHVDGIRVYRITGSVDHRCFVSKISSQCNVSTLNRMPRITRSEAARGHCHCEVRIDRGYRLPAPVSPRPLERSHVASNIKRRRRTIALLHNRTIFGNASQRPGAVAGIDSGRAGVHIDYHRSDLLTLCDLDDLPISRR